MLSIFHYYSYKLSTLSYKDPPLTAALIGLIALYLFNLYIWDYLARRGPSPFFPGYLS
jgi:hypothetical protein